nr:hypothetical protein [Tanacetum cinerariifolium]
MIDYMLQRQCYANDAHYDMPLIFYIHARGLHFDRHEFSLITCLRFGEVSFSCYSKGELKFRSRVFPHRVGLKIASLDLIGVIENEEFFSKICNEDVVHVCLLLSLEVIFMGLISNHKAEHLKGLHMSRNYVPTYTLSGFVWSFKDSKPTVVLRPTFGEYLTERWIFNNKILKNYIPRTPTRTPDLFYACLLKFQTSTLYVLVRKTNGVVVHKLEFSEDFPNLSTEICDELNIEFLKLFDSPSSSSSGTCCSDLDIDEDADEEYLLQEQFKMKLEEEEMLLFKKEQILEEESRLRLEEETMMMREKENMLDEEKFYKKDYKKQDLDLYLGKPGMLRFRFPWCSDQMVDRKFWESLVCLDPPRIG